jgi:hypothetical protein
VPSCEKGFVCERTSCGFMRGGIGGRFDFFGEENFGIWEVIEPVKGRLFFAYGSRGNWL